MGTPFAARHMNVTTAIPVRRDDAVETTTLCISSQKRGIGHYSQTRRLFVLFHVTHNNLLCAREEGRESWQ